MSLPWKGHQKFSRFQGFDTFLKKKVAKGNCKLRQKGAQIKD